MKNKNDYEYIKNKFDNDNIAAPSSLAENVIAEKLYNREQKRIKLYQTKGFKSAISAVACFAIVITALAVANPFSKNQNEPIPNTTNTTAEDSVLETFKSIDELKEHISSYSYQTGEIPKSDSDLGLLTQESDSQSGGNVDRQSFGKTYQQYQNVNEGDLVKNNGEYIFHYSQENGIIRIFDKKGSLVSLIKDFEMSNIVIEDSTQEADEEVDLSEEFMLREFYLYEDKLIANSVIYSYSSYGMAEGSTKTTIYDISDIKKPTAIKSFTQSGALVSSRMIDDTLYIISNQMVIQSNCKSDNDYLPYTCEDDGENQYLSLKSIAYCPNNKDQSNYLVASAINVGTCEKSAKTKAILGGGTNIYCNENNLYIAVESFIFKYSGSGAGELTIIKASLSPNSIDFVATGQVEGYVDNQFQMDEKDGNLRIATTVLQDNGSQSNNIYVLNKDLKVMGSLKNIAKGESIKAVRFIGDTAYMITYHRIDPLFVVDLTDPTNPTLKGEVKISGFSSMLVPVESNKLLGIGYETKIIDGNETVLGLKLVLFDVSNPQKPTILDTRVFKHYNSVTQYDHHGLVVNQDKGYYAIPYDIYNYDTEDPRIGSLVFEIKNDKIAVTNDIQAKGTPFAYDSRCTYIDNTMYLLDCFGHIYTFAIK